MIDDLATRGVSSIEALTPLRDHYLVHDLLVLIDRESGAAQRLSEHNVNLHAVVTLSELLDEWARAQLVDSAHLEETRRWLDAQRAPQ